MRVEGKKTQQCTAVNRIETVERDKPRPTQGTKNEGWNLQVCFPTVFFFYLEIFVGWLPLAYSLMTFVGFNTVLMLLFSQPKIILETSCE